MYLTLYRPTSGATPLYSLYGYMYVPQGRVYMVFDLSVLNRVYNFVEVCQQNIA